MATGLPTDLLPDHLRTGWRAVEEQRLPTAAFERDREQAFEAYRTVWAHALSRGGSSDLAESLVNELAGYLNIDPAEVQRRCAHATAALADDWRTHVDPADSRSVERYYDGTEHFLYDLTWWHTLTDDVSPLSYVLALHFAEQHGCRRYCDFGSGVGAGTLLFAAHDFEVTPADISSTLLAFTQWRLTQRGIQHHAIDLKTTALPPSAFDFISAMDVFEHLTDPVGTVEQLWQSLVPGGYLCGRFHGEEDASRPQHIVIDFEPTFRRMEALGFHEVWRDDWLWGHQIFQRG